MSTKHISLNFYFIYAEYTIVNYYAETILERYEIGWFSGIIAANCSNLIGVSLIFSELLQKSNNSQKNLIFQHSKIITIIIQWYYQSDLKKESFDFCRAKSEELK